jgi:hypothetical protein
LGTPSKPEQACIQNENLHFVDGIIIDDDAPTPKLLHGGSDPYICGNPGNFGNDLLARTTDPCESENDDATPLKRDREGGLPSPDSVGGPSGTMPPKRMRERVLAASYTDPNQIDLVPNNFHFSARAFGDPDDIDGEPLDESSSPPTSEKQRVATLILPLPTSNRPLIRRATDFPLPPPSPTRTPSPRSSRQLLHQVFGIDPPPNTSPGKLWRKLREDSKCPICMDVLVRPVDVAGCGHYVCRCHVIDLYQYGGSETGIRCVVCRKENPVKDFNRIEVDQKKWSDIQRARFHQSRRRSLSPSRSLTPLRDRFNRKFLQDDDF